MELENKVIKVPSNGYFGGPNEITIRPMTTAEEKILYSTRDASFLKKIVKACTVEPKDLDTSKLHPNDFVYLMYQIRNLTFGSTYSQKVACPVCGFKQVIEVNISNFEYLTLETGEELEKKLIIELPISNQKIQLKLLSQGDLDELDARVKRLVMKDQLKGDPDTYAHTQRIIESIDRVVDKEFANERDKEEFVNNLHLKDLQAIISRLNSIEFGIDTSVTMKCARCEEEVEVFGAFCPEFFRPIIE